MILPNQQTHLSWLFHFNILNILINLNVDAWHLLAICSSVPKRIYRGWMSLRLIQSSPPCGLYSISGLIQLISQSGFFCCCFFFVWLWYSDFFIIWWVWVLAGVWWRCKEWIGTVFQIFAYVRMVEGTIWAVSVETLVLYPNVAEIWVRVRLRWQSLFSTATWRQKFPLFGIPPFHSSVLEPYFYLVNKIRRKTFQRIGNTF